MSSGLLPVGDGQSIAWDVEGDGKPIVVLHGGPGQGCTPRMRRAFDASKHRVVLFDQRGCGRSTPHASDPRTDMRHNTTAALVNDIEKLREHLGVDRWLVCGMSWGTTLALAYAETHPERVSEMLLMAITTFRRKEIDVLYRGLSRLFPEAWSRFSAHVDGEIFGGYVRRLESADDDVRISAARAWCAWEDACLSTDTLSKLPAREMIAFARICAHYCANDAFLEEGELIRNAHRLAPIPATLIHGRLDLTCPIETAIELAGAWPSAKLVILEQSGHLATDESREAFAAALG